MSAELQRAVREIDARVPFYNVSRFDEHTKAATFQQKLAGDLLIVFGALALLLAGIGSYGVLSFLVGLRRREIGIRLAVGATRADVFRLVAASGARLVMVGLVLGLLLSVGVGMGLQSLLIGISPGRPGDVCGRARRPERRDRRRMPVAGAASRVARSGHDPQGRINRRPRETKQEARRSGEVTSSDLLISCSVTFDLLFVL